VLAGGLTLAYDCDSGVLAVDLVTDASASPAGAGRAGSDLRSLIAQVSSQSRPLDRPASIAPGPVEQEEAVTSIAQ